MPEKNYISAEQLMFPTDKTYDHIGILNNQVIVFNEERGKVFYALENEPVFEEVPDKRKEFCPEDDFYKSLHYSDATILPDKRLGLIGDCELNSPLMFAYDLNTGKMEKIVEETLPPAAHNYSWNPDMTKGVQDTYTDLTGTIFWIDSEKPSPMDIVLSDGTRSWSLADEFPRYQRGNQKGTAAFPVWSPGGKQIAFFATFDTIGGSGFSRLDSEYNIYIMDYETLNPVRVLEGIYRDFPITLAWSPNGKYLSFTGKYGFPVRRYGLWILTLESKEVYFIDEDVTKSVWRNDGKSIVGMKCFNDSCSKPEIWEYSLINLQ